MSEQITNVDTLMKSENEETKNQHGEADSPGAGEVEVSNETEGLEGENYTTEDTNNDSEESIEDSEETEEVESDENTEEEEGSEPEYYVNSKGKKVKVERVEEIVEKRLKRDRKLRQAEFDNYKKQVEQYLGGQNTIVNNQNFAFDPSTQIQDPFTGNVVDINSTEGQVIVKLQQLSKLAETQEQEAKKKQEQENLRQKIMKGYNKFDDYEDVLSNSGISDVMLEAAALSDITDEILYNLAKYKPEEIERINKLSPKNQFREMVLIENEIKRNSKKKIVKKVPIPPKKIKGSGAVITNPENMSFDDLLAMRRNEQRKKMGG